MWSETVKDACTDLVPALRAVPAEVVLRVYEIASLDFDAEYPLSVDGPLRTQTWHKYLRARLIAQLTPWAAG